MGKQLSTIRKDKEENSEREWQSIRGNWWSICRNRKNNYVIKVDN
jgi:hypothetical protein